jgi:hypothetical protein
MRGVNDECLYQPGFVDSHRGGFELVPCRTAGLTREA